MTFGKFRPKNFLPSSTNRFYIEIISMGEKVKSLQNEFIFLTKNRLLVQNIEIQEGNIATSEIQLFDFFKIEYPKSWQKPEEMSITFIDSTDGKIFKLFHKYAKLCKLDSFKGISPVNLDKYSFDIKIYRYTNTGKIFYTSTYKIFPKILPKWIDDYSDNNLQTFNIEFMILDYSQDLS